MGKATTTTTTTTPTPLFTIYASASGNFWILRGNDILRNKYGSIRVFATRNSARKRIARERSGDFHR